jgi:hypothetical protein
MNLTQIHRFLLLIGAGGIVVSGANGQTPTATSASSLSPIAFLTAHEWDAKLPDSPDGKKMKIHAQFTWAQNRQAIRISNQFVTDGKAVPYIDGLYAWDPRQHAIAFWYVDAKGSLSKGTVKVEEGKLVHEFQETQPDGKTAQFVAKVTPHGDQGWENEIFARKENGLTPIVKVRYEAAD